jgi:hypothetical protein
MKKVTCPVDGDAGITYALGISTGGFEPMRFDCRLCDRTFFRQSLDAEMHRRYGSLEQR